MWLTPFALGRRTSATRLTKVPRGFLFRFFAAFVAVIRRDGVDHERKAREPSKSSSQKVGAINF
jgi:hypothetical protein